MATDSGYGQQTPNSSTDDFNRVSFIVQQMIGRMMTMMPVQVTAVQAGAGSPPVAGTVSVQPLVNQIDGDGNATSHGVVNGIPWFRLQGGKNAVICEPEVGDIGYVDVSSRDISAVKSTKARANPGSRRKFSLSDGVYVGGFLNVAPNQYLIFTATGIRVVDKNGNSLAMDNSGITATDLSGNVISTTSTGITLTPKSGQPVTVAGSLIVQNNLELGGSFQGATGGLYAGDLKTSGNIIAGFGTGDQVGLQTHTHHQPNDSHGDTEAATNAPTAGT